MEEEALDISAIDMANTKSTNELSNREFLDKTTTKTYKKGMSILELDNCLLICTDKDEFKEIFTDNEQLLYENLGLATNFVSNPLSPEELVKKISKNTKNEDIRDIAEYELNRRVTKKRNLENPKEKDDKMTNYYMTGTYGTSPEVNI